MQSHCMATAFGDCRSKTKILPIRRKQYIINQSIILPLASSGYLDVNQLAKSKPHVALVKNPVSLVK